MKIKECLHLDFSASVEVVKVGAANVAEVMLHCRRCRRGFKFQGFENRPGRDSVNKPGTSPCGYKVYLPLTVGETPN